MLQEQCLWEVTAPTIDAYRQISSDTQTTVCIIGGGYTGLSAAIHLAEKGVEVVLLEGHTIGDGGSGKSVGLVNAGKSKRRVSQCGNTKGRCDKTPPHVPWDKWR